MKTEVTVLLQGTMREYIIDLSLAEVVRIFETSDNLIVPNDKSYAYINKKECPIIEFKELDI